MPIYLQLRIPADFFIVGTDPLHKPVTRAIPARQEIVPARI